MLTIYFYILLLYEKNQFAYFFPLELSYQWPVEQNFTYASFVIRNCKSELRNEFRDLQNLDYNIIRRSLVYFFFAN